MSKSNEVNSTELLSCPFCGASAQRLQIAGERYDEIWCTNDPECAAKVEGDNYADAVRIWNRRDNACICQDGQHAEHGVVSEVSE